MRTQDKVLLSLIALLLCSCTASMETAGRNNATCGIQASANTLALEFLESELPEEIEYESDGVVEEDAFFYFFFIGTGSYKRPGYHWIVEVEKETCALHLAWGK